MSSTKLIRISNNDRVSGNGTKFSVNLGFEETEIHRVLKTTLVSLVFNNNHTNVNPSNNTFSYEIGGVPNSITIPVGQYSTTTLIAEIISQEPAFTITQSSTTYLLNFTVGTTCKILSSGLGSFIGFTEDSATAASVDADAIPNLNGLDLVMIKSDTLAKNNMIDTDRKEHSVLSVVPVNVSFGLNAVFHDTGIDESSHVVYRSRRNLTAIDIELTDQNHNPVYIDGQIDIILKVYF